LQRFPKNWREAVISNAQQGEYLAAIAAMNNAQAAVDDTVRTWFHNVQSVR
jgi:hypothetical protein